MEKSSSTIRKITQPDRNDEGDLMTLPFSSKTPCSNCFNFKTRLVTIKNSKSKKNGKSGDSSLIYGKVARMLSRDGEAQIYYCKKDRLKQAVYVGRNESVPKISKEGCPEYDA